jgi:dipeptidyl aminopeptidase/acylaminoacyl peptidase
MSTLRLKISWMAGIFLGVAGLLAGCTAGLPVSTRPTSPSPSVQVLSPQPTATPTPTQSSTLPPTPSPTATITPSPTRTFTPTPTLHPLAVEGMRQRSYPGSLIKFEQTLEPGANYDRYLVSYQSDGLKINALLTVPRGKKPATGWPVIIFNHGYIPPAEYRTTEHYVAHVDILSRAGYIVIKPDYRGHGSSEGIALGGYGAPDYTVDVLNALGSIKQFQGADPDRIGMWGHSMGGHITLRAMVVSKEIKAGVIWAGVVASYPDLLSKWHSPPPPELPESVKHWHEQLAALVGAPEQNPAFWASISPITYVADLSGPLQLHHGTKDADVPYEFSVTLDAALKKASVPDEFYTYPGAGHNLLNMDFSQAIYRTIAFFDHYLK